MIHGILPPSQRTEWLRAIMDSGHRLVAPMESPAGLLFGAVRDASDVRLDAALPVKSPKGAFLPQSEAILRYKNRDGAVTVEDVDDFARPTVLLGVHPCDASAGDILDKVFDGKLKDKFYLERREKTIIIALGCKEAIDASCFCTSVGIARDSRNGADVYTELDDSGSLYIESVTDRGEQFLTALGVPLEATAMRMSAPDSDGDHAFDVKRVKAWLNENFESDFWKEMTLQCIGCGTCTFLCPVCHCFDIVDEARGSEGVRKRNWDSCQFGLFTRHASGHNPRHDQAARFRQRIMHKFKYYSDNFDKTLCVGCGRCVRSCPVGMSLLDVLTEIDRLSRESELLAKEAGE